MLFHTPQYAFFLVIVVILFWLLRRSSFVRIWLLWVASYFFYACWNFWYLGLILSTSIVDYNVGRLIAKQKSPGKKKQLLAVSVIFDLGVLAVFKYFNFLSSGTGWLASLLGINIYTPYLDIILPVGISFYTFQSLSYTIDIYRGKIEPARSFAGFALFVSFFPQLVAGPIVRASHLLPQLYRKPGLDDAKAIEGIFRIAVGMLKKVVLADLLAVHLVDQVFANPGDQTTGRLWLGLVGYSFQLYGDFSGYSDIAIGSAALLGFNIPENFNRPYLAKSMREFWERWHISLSTWLRDYLYFSIGGSRHSAPRTYINLFITMFLVGLWHGAAWNFVVWGLYISTVMLITRYVQQRARNAGIEIDENGASAWLLRILFFFTLALSWPIFRAGTPDDMITYYNGLIGNGGGTAQHALLPVILILVAAAAHVLPSKWDFKLREKLVALHPALAAWIMVAFMVLLTRVASEAQPFIYFQF